MAHSLKGKKNLIVGLLKAFYWMDDGMQNYLRSLGWLTLSRTQSMIMMNVIAGNHRGIEIARNLGLSRQAVYLTLNDMVKQGVIALEDDPDDGRSKRVILTKDVEPMRRDARKAIEIMSGELGRRFGADALETLVRVFAADWGSPMNFDAGKVSAPKKRSYKKRRAGAAS